MATRTIVSSGRVTLRDATGIECEIETDVGPRLLTLRSPTGDVNDSIEIVLIHESLTERGVAVDDGLCPDCGGEPGSCFYCKMD